MNFVEDITLGYSRSTVGNIYLHRYVAEQKLGRPLKRSEVVHHIDRNRSNNDPTNLIVFRTSADHTKHHSLGYYSRLVLHTDGSYSCEPRNSYFIENTKHCKQCGKPFFNKIKSVTHCSVKCSNVRYDGTNSLISVPKTKQDLHRLVWNESTVQLSKKLKCSDVAIAKWCKKFGVSKPPRGFWTKIYNGIMEGQHCPLPD